MLAFTRTGEILKSALSLNPPLALKDPPPPTLKSTDAFGAATSTLTGRTSTLELKPAEPLNPAFRFTLGASTRIGFTSTLADGAFTDIPAFKFDDSLKPMEPPNPPLVCILGPLKSASTLTGRTLRLAYSLKPAEVLNPSGAI